MSTGDYKAKEITVEVPTDTGLEGFLVALRSILKLPRVVNVQIDARGKVTYTRFLRDDDPRKNIEVDFDTVLPSTLVRNADLAEIDLVDEGNAAICVAAMFREAQGEQLYPIAWVTGANTSLLEWHRMTTGVSLIGGRAYGLPIHQDRFIPDETLVLATAFEPGAALIDIRKGFKITMPARRDVFPTHRSLVPRILTDVAPSVEMGEHLVAGEVPKLEDIDVLPGMEKPQ